MFTFVLMDSNYSEPNPETFHMSLRRHYGRTKGTIPSEAALLLQGLRQNRSISQDIQPLFDRSRAAPQDSPCGMVGFTGGFQLQQPAVIVIGPFGVAVSLKHAARPYFGGCSSPLSQPAARSLFSGSRPSHSRH